MKRGLLALTIAAAMALTPYGASASVPQTTFPVVFAHGMGGFDNILGYDYWGDDFGVFVGDPCNEFLEITCNGNIDSRQRSFIARVQPFQSSEIRGTQLANEIESYMATTGVRHVNIVGHSQGGVDLRKASKVLSQRRGYQVVRVAVSISSPHRGSPVAKYILDLGPGVTSVLNALVTMYGNVVYQSGNDGFAAVKQMVYNDYSPNDGAVTGMKVYNENNPVSSAFAARYVSIVTAQRGLDLNPALFILRNGFFNIDGDGFCADDCDNDGAAGRGNGVRTDLDDDGLVGINSQQMGFRLRYHSILGQDYLSTNTALGYVGNINYPNSAQMTSTADIVNQDHMDVIGIGPDLFDEMEFYAAIYEYIAHFD